MEVAEVSRTKFDPYVIGNNIRDLREKRKMTQIYINKLMWNNLQIITR